MRAVSDPANAPSPARTYSFIEPALGIIVASSEKLSACMYMATMAIARATRKIQLAANPWPTDTSTVVATTSPNTVLIAVGRPTARRSSCGAAVDASICTSPPPGPFRPDDHVGVLPRVLLVLHAAPVADEQGEDLSGLEHRLQRQALVDAVDPLPPWSKSRWPARRGARSTARRSWRWWAPGPA